MIPKGWPIKGLKAAKSAAREAYEEAGVRGSIKAKALGMFSYEKRLAQLPKLTADFETAILTGLDVSPCNCPIGREGMAAGAEIVTKRCRLYPCVS